jgi:hypothetical protein
MTERYSLHDEEADQAGHELAVEVGERRAGDGRNSG